MSCPICAREGDAAYRPFCSKRCADVDLGRWLGGHYAVPGTAPAEPQEAPDVLARNSLPLH
ncbi:DNA gyrase inhibitor YacG [Shimia sp.]|uniref:DNA gyrase inhibitor YacG n=1 Tax=Shimia sp. TaxID=1954381 RepID=UPI0035689032